jgi:hypothetical protein
MSYVPDTHTSARRPSSEMPTTFDSYYPKTVSPVTFSGTRILLLLFLFLPLGAQGIRETLISLQFLNLRQSVGLLGRGISPSQGRYLHTGQHKHRINANRHSCLE